MRLEAREQIRYGMLHSRSVVRRIHALRLTLSPTRHIDGMSRHITGVIRRQPNNELCDLFRASGAAHGDCLACLFPQSIRSDRGLKHLCLCESGPHGTHSHAFAGDLNATSL